MRKSDRIFGLSVAILSALFLGIAVPSISDSWKSQVGTQYFTVGPTLFPYIAGALCLFFSVWLALRPPEGPDHDSGISVMRVPGVAWNVLLTIVLSVVYIIAVPFAGFVPATVILIAVFLPLFGERRPMIIVPVAIVTPLFLHYTLLDLFALDLPSGVFDLPL